MATDDWIMIILFSLAALVIGAVAGFFLGRRTGRDQKSIRQLEKELARSKDEQESYRKHINDHFQKTSELFSQMTDSYKAVFMHLAEGSEELCTSDAAMLKPADDRFLVLEYEKDKKSTAEAPAAPQPPAAESTAEYSGSAGDAEQVEENQPAAEEMPDQEREQEKKSMQP